LQDDHGPSHHQSCMQYDHQRVALASYLGIFLVMPHCRHPKNNTSS